MAERKNLSDTPPRGALAEGAERLDRIARSARTQPANPAPGSPIDDASRVLAISPDEVWAKNYMSHAIGPKLESSALLGMAPVAHLVSMPKFVPPTELRPEPIVTRTAPIAEQPMIPAVKASGPIGAHIGKPMRKRSWLGRMLMGRG
ncbi:MAG: hypothetical protein ABSA49_13065 [Rhizomicrobium sp.]|jgi:hypothetical protein